MHPQGAGARTRPAHVHGADSAHTQRKITARSDLRVHVIVSKSSCTPRVCACARFMRAHRRCARYVCTGTLRVLCTYACTLGCMHTHAPWGACVPHRRCGVTSRGAKRRVRHEKKKNEATERSEVFTSRGAKRRVRYEKRKRKQCVRNAPFGCIPCSTSLRSVPCTVRPSDSPAAGVPSGLQ